MKYVLYHGNCYDGFGAAFAAWKKFGDRAEYIPVSYGYLPPAMPGATEIYIIDFSYPGKILSGLADKCKVVVLDHHKTAEADLKDLRHPNMQIEFNMKKSGAMLAWDYFHGIDKNLDHISSYTLIRYIQDRDLWLFELPECREVHAALVSYPMDFELWDRFDIFGLRAEGRILLRQYNQLVDNICKKAFLTYVGNYKVPVVNTSIAWSEVGERLGEIYPNSLFVASFTEFEDQTMWSLRPSKNFKHFDVSDVAKLFGGGGHRSAAGFKTQRTIPIAVTIESNAGLQ